jgi:hypothetical protein
VQRHQIDGMACEMPRVHRPPGAACNQRGLPLARAQASWTRKLLVVIWIALDHPNQVGVHAVGPITRQLAEKKRPFDATPSGR